MTMTIRANEQLMASKGSGSEYSAAQLSDGERNALLIAGSVLTAPPNTLLIIDEPERHLHRSIISPLLCQLFAKRSDCGFVISTHDHNLPLEISEAKILLLRCCNFDANAVQSWEADELPADSSIDEEIKQDLLGARRNILFVEGTENSLDKSLYSLIFPLVSVIPKGSCKDVEYSVKGSRAGEPFHWLRAFGIIDGDGLSSEQIDEKREKGVYALPYYSVEAIYFHPEVVEKIATKQVEVTGGDAKKLCQRALRKGVDAIKPNIERLSLKVTKKMVRKLVEDNIPNDDELLAGKPINIENNAPIIQKKRQKELDTAVKENDWETILSSYPVRESSALSEISSCLGFQKVKKYESAVRHLLSTDEEALRFVRGLFGDLVSQLEV